MGSTPREVHGGTWVLELHWLCGAGWVSSRNTKEQRDLVPVNVDDCFLYHERGQDGSPRDCKPRASLMLHSSHQLKPGSTPTTRFRSCFDYKFDR